MKAVTTLFVAVIATAMVTTNRLEERKLSPSMIQGTACLDPPPLSQTAQTSYVDVNGTRLAYRRFGKRRGFPVVYLNHFRASMDVIDPLLMNCIAQTREVILFDNSGVGHSEGTVQDSIGGMATTAVDFLTAIDVPKANIFGFSMGGRIAQYISMEYPDVVEKLIFSGTQPANGAGVVQPDPKVREFAVGNGGQPTLDDMLALFFYPSATSTALGRDWWNRIMERQVKGENRTGFVEGPGLTSQLTAMSNFALNSAYYSRLQDIKTPVLVTNGKTDIMAPTVNSFVIQQLLPYSDLHVYPDSGHGHPFQFPVAYAKALEQFLEG